MSGRPDPDREKIENALTRFVLGEADRQESEELLRLLVDRPELNAELASLQRVLTLLPHAVATPPPPELKARILAAARGSAPAPVRRRVVWPSLAAAAGLAAAALLVQNISLRRDLDLQREVAILLQQPNVVLSFAMSGTGSSPTSFGSVVLDLDAKKGAVVLRGLPALPPQKVYRLWALVGDQTVPCGQFNASPEAAVRTVFPVPVDAYTAPVTRLILTVEPVSAPPRPLGPTVMVGASVS